MCDRRPYIEGNLLFDLDPISFANPRRRRWRVTTSTLSNYSTNGSPSQVLPVVV